MAECRSAGIPVSQAKIRRKLRELAPTYVVDVLSGPAAPSQARPCPMRTILPLGHAALCSVPCIHAFIHSSRP